jgi:hypothetical protein
LIGAQYWLSPLGIFQERVEKLAQLRAQYKIQTPLCVLSRLINIQAYEKTRRGSLIIDESQFWSIAQSQIQLVIEKEKELGGYLDLAEIGYSTNLSALPFLFFAPEHCDYAFKKYRSDGSEVNTEGGVSGSL